MIKQNLCYSVERAENGTRTRDPNLGKVVLYQLSYFRKEQKRCEEEETRTPTSQLTLPPQSSASTNSATSPTCNTTFTSFRSASLLIAGAKVMLFSELTKLFPTFFQKIFLFFPFTLYIHPAHLIIYLNFPHPFLFNNEFRELRGFSYCVFSVFLLFQPNRSKIRHSSDCLLIANSWFTCLIREIRLNLFAKVMTIKEKTVTLHSHSERVVRKTHE